MIAKNKSFLSVRTEVLEYDGYFYSTLDMAYPDERARATSGSANAQVTPLPLRPGWELATERSGLADILAKCNWAGADRVVLADGNAHPTWHGHASRKPSIVGKNLLTSTKNCFDSTLYMPHRNAGEARVLIQRAVTTGQESAIPGGTHCQELISRVWKKRRFTDFTIYMCWPGDALPSRVAGRSITSI